LLLPQTLYNVVIENSTRIIFTPISPFLYGCAAIFR
jgi:hypothetical protein